MAELNLFIKSQHIQIFNDQNINKQKIKHENSIYSNHIFLCPGFNHDQNKAKTACYFNFTV